MFSYQSVNCRHVTIVTTKCSKEQAHKKFPYSMRAIWFADRPVGTFIVRPEPIGARCGAHRHCKNVSKVTFVLMCAISEHFQVRHQ